MTYWTTLVPFSRTFQGLFHLIEEDEAKTISKISYIGMVRGKGVFNSDENTSSPSQRVSVLNNTPNIKNRSTFFAVRLSI